MGHGSFEDEKQPWKIDFLKNHQVDEISCGLNHTCFRTNQGVLMVTGKGTNGQTGLGQSKNTTLPTILPYLDGLYVSQVSCGWNHTLILIDPYHIYATGMNKYGQLGTGNLENQMVFTLIGRTKGKNVWGVVAGGHH